MKTVSKVRTRKRSKTWSYIFEAGRTGDGKRKVVERGGFKTEAEAYEEGTKAFVDWKHGNIGITSPRVKMSDFLVAWLGSIEQTVTQTTFYRYKLIADKLSKSIGQTAVQDVTPRMVDIMLRNMAGEGLAYSTMQNYRAVLVQALKYAIYPCELIQNNPASAIKIPAKKEKVTKRTVITKEHYQKLLDTFEIGNPYRLPIVIAYTTGMRIGEILGLEWNNIDRSKRVIHVVQQTVLVGTSDVKVSSTKTKGSIRDIYYGEALEKEINEWEECQKHYAEIRGGGYIEAYTDTSGTVIQFSKSVRKSVNTSKMSLRNFVCTQKNGKCVRKFSLGHTLTKLGINAHSFRHTHATILAENGASPKEIASRLGHSSIMTTDVYMHSTDAMNKNSAKIFDEAIKE